MRVLFFTFLYFAAVFSQGVNDWQTITNMNDVTDIAFQSDAVWVTTSGGLYKYHLGDNSVKRYTNIDGLKTIQLSAIDIDLRDNLITGGATGLLELYDTNNNQWEQLYSLEGNEVKDIHFYNDTLWVTAGNGLGVFFWDGSRYVFKDYFFNFPVLIEDTRYVQRFANRIWVGTEQGLLSAPSDLNRYTINDPANWNLMTTANGLPHPDVWDIQVIEDRLWICTAGGLMTIDQKLEPREEDKWGDANANFIATASGHQYVAKNKRYYKYTTTEGASDEVILQAEIQVLRTDNNGNRWAGLEEGGLYCSIWEKPLKLDGPQYNTIRNILKDKQDRIWASSVNLDFATANLGYYLYDGNRWRNTTFSGFRWYEIGNSVAFHVDRFDNIWIGSWGGGLVTFKANADTVYFHNYTSDGEMRISTNESQTTRSQTNAIRLDGYFSGISTNPSYEIISAINEDDYGRIWFGNYWAANDHLLTVAPYNDDFISLNKNDWAYFGQADGIQAEQGGISCIDFDDFGRVWIGTIRDGVYVLDYNNTLYDKSDDQLYHLVVNDNLYSNQIKSIAADGEGIVWIGTGAGLNSFDGVNVYKHVGDETGLGGPLENTINDIFIDKYNNRWFATTGGLSILRAGRSPWDNQAWQGFTVDNSGLVDNKIFSVFVNSASSEALLGTQNGISIYSGTFAQIQDDFTQTIGGPNPFIIGSNHNNYYVKKLKNNSIVKIFNLNGQLVRELTTEDGLVDGSQAVWDGKDMNGNVVSSGIYLYSAFDEEGDASAGKIAVIRK